MSTELNELAVRLGKLGDRTARQVVDVLEQVVSGTIPASDLPELAVILMELGGDQAAALTVSELAAELAAIVGPSADLPSLSHASGNVNRSKALQATQTIMAGDAAEHAMRLERLSRSVVAEAGQRGRTSALRSSTLVEGWTRGLDSDSCELCGWWSRGGRVWPKDHHMPTHPGCTCVQVPVVRSDIAGVSREAYDESAERRTLDRQGRYLETFGMDRRHNPVRI